MVLAAATVGAVAGLASRPVAAQTPDTTVVPDTTTVAARIGGVVAAPRLGAPAAAVPTGLDGAVAPDWRLVVEGTSVAWEREPPALPLDSLRTVARRAVAQLQRDGYLLARLDAVTRDTARAPPVVRLHVARGPEVVLDTLRLVADSVFSEADLRPLFETRAGRPLAPTRLEADFDAVLARYEDAGYPLAQIRIDSLGLRLPTGADAGATADADPGAAPTLDLRLVVRAGPRLVLQRVALSKGARTSPRFAARVMGVDVGAPLMGYDPRRLQARLEATGLYRAVERPELRITPGGEATLYVPVTEAPPGRFDLVLGYLPPNDPNGGGGGFVGSGTLGLVNLFGGGRTLDLELDRRPDQASLFDVAVADPFVAGLPLRIEARFRGEQRDSTFGKQAYRLRAGYRFAGGDLEAFATAARELTKPGIGGERLAGTEQLVPRATATFYGLGITQTRLANRLNPRRGFTYELALERGTKARTGTVVTAAGDTLRQDLRLTQERLTAHGRLYLPVLRRQVVALGADAHVLLSDRYDTSDLFRFGGARSLRGYDEDRFTGNVVGRLVVEMRQRLDRTSYAFAFGDLGYVERPALGPTPARRGLQPGYGFGLQFGTALGLVNLSYALSPGDGTPVNGRIHLGLEVEL